MGQRVAHVHAQDNAQKDAHAQDDTQNDTQKGKNDTQNDTQKDKNDTQNDTQNITHNRGFGRKRKHRSQAFDGRHQI